MTIATSLAATWEVQLDAWLEALGYDPAARQATIAHAARYGNLTNCPAIAHRDREDATYAFWEFSIPF